MARAGTIVADTLSLLGENIRPGATTASSASASASRSVSATSSTAPRSAAVSAVARSSSYPATVAPARFAARPTEAPIRPVPTNAIRTG